jgi:hypothetical protein
LSVFCNSELIKAIEEDSFGDMKSKVMVVTADDKLISLEQWITLIKLPEYMQRRDELIREQERLNNPRTYYEN